MGISESCSRNEPMGGAVTADPGRVEAGREEAGRDEARRRLAAPERLRSLFAPRSVALVGASEGSGWARFIVESLRTAGLPGRLVPVHRKLTEAFGVPTVPTLRDLDE